MMSFLQTAAVLAQPETFNPEKSLPLSLFDQITEIRVHHPEIVEREARRRKRRSRLTADGKLALVAADHAGRGVTKLRNDQLAMGDRYQLLARVRRFWRTQAWTAFLLLVT